VIKLKPGPDPCRQLVSFPMPYGSGSVGDAWSWPSEGILALRRGPAELAPRH